MAKREEEGPWGQRSLVDLLEEPDQVSPGDAELERGAAAVPAVAGEGGQDLLALQEIDLAAEPARRLGVGRRGAARMEELHEHGAVDQLLASRAEEDRLH